MANSTPSTLQPAKRGGALEDLLQLFGSQSSATSVTKARRESPTSKPRPPVADVSKPHDNHVSPPTKSNDPAFTLTPRSTPCPVPPASDILGIATQSSDFTSDTESGIVLTQDHGTNVADIVDSPSDNRLPSLVRPARTPSRIQVIGELRMEPRRSRREPDETPRRSLRRKDDILESDTVSRSPPTAGNRKPRLPRKLDTARARLRDDIAQKTKVKADDFLTLNKDFFLPLLPQHNYITRLIAKGQTGSVVPYKSIERQPHGINAIMKPYQLEGLSFLVHLYNNGFSGILGDEMGLGKTLQTLSLFQYLEELDRDTGVTSEELRPYLVICPLSVLNNWVSEIQKFTPHMRVLRYHGGPKERDRLKRIAQGLEDRYGNETLRSRDRKVSQKAGVKVSKLATEASSSSYNIVVTTYDSFHADHTWFKHSFIWRYVVLDEGHKIKNKATQLSASLRNVSSEYRLILTGTPLQNNLLEMWALLAWLYPDVFTENTHALFKESFDLGRGKVNRKTLDDARHLLELIMIRRMKDSPNVNLGLPPKEEVLLYVPLTPMQRFWYTRLLTKVDDGLLDDLFADNKAKELAALETDRQDARLVAKMEKVAALTDAGKADDQWEETAQIARQAIKNEQQGDGNTSIWKRLMNLVVQLRKCCSHPYLLPGAVPEPYHIGQHLVRASGKFILLEKLLKNSIFQLGKKVLIFSSFTQTLDCCEDLLSMISNFGQEFRFLRLDGGTQRARRNLGIRLFNEANSAYRVMLLSTRAGGLGINLTAAEDVVFLDEDWNPQITLQAEARAHRIGQMKKVTIYKICTQGTVEEQMMGRIRKKLYLSAKITESMQNIHGEDYATLKTGTSVSDDVPKISTTQLKTLVRRGAQTLSHPEIDVNSMLSWDLNTMMQNCRDKATEPVPTGSEADGEFDEEKWLSVMERVECAVLDGKRYQRNNAYSNKTQESILPASATRQDRRKGKNVTVMVDGFAVNKESLRCADGEAVPTLAGKDVRLAEPEREKRHEYQHEEHCLMCFDGADSGHLIGCKSCPRAYHFNCLEEAYQAKVKGFQHFFCPQHVCCDCGKHTTDAGGLIYRCRWCPRGFCEDCLAETQTEELVGDNLPEFEMLGEGVSSSGFYIKCHECIACNEEDEARKEWMGSMELSYAEQHETWVQMKKEEQVRIEEEDAANEARRHHFRGEEQMKDCVCQSPSVIDGDKEFENDALSPPSLTEDETASATPGPGFSTPRSEGNGVQSRKRIKEDMEANFGGLGRSSKKGKLDGDFLGGI
ncbi:unnamed protein product [Periconia digitata]|uniref:ISWI chromatin-remodeling complex ATPase ISW2 n=1 Tax=Periconia digitata TaxID=1303443 RepID=A0A9W4UV90_9PLEO|nr:unnamed protein product [Periconia digitata]